MDKADMVVILREEYTMECMKARNRYMVDNSCRCICYFKYMRGGTYYTVNYAKNKGIEILNIASDD